MTDSSLKHHFLIAMPGMDDPNFAFTLTYLCEHNDEGAMGLIINRPLDITVGDVMSQLHVDGYAVELDQQPVLQGGPVQPDRGFVLHRDTSLRDQSLVLDDDLFLTTSKDSLAALARGEHSQPSLMALGYAGWGAGQLEEELANNTWLSVGADTNIIFNTPFDQRWQAAASLLGVDLRLLSMDAGHA